MTREGTWDLGVAFGAYLDLLNRESDRGAVIVGAAVIDDVLREVLQARLVVSPETEDELLGDSRPCSTFAARIDLAHRIGSIRAILRSDLHLVRKMRNEAAHVAEHRDFQSPQVKDRLRALVQRDGSLLDILRQIGPASAKDDRHSTLEGYLDALGNRGSWNVYIAFLAVALRTMVDIQARLPSPEA